MTALHYLGASDLAALAFTDAELLAAVEAGFAAHGTGDATIEPRIALGRGPGKFTLQRGAIAPQSLAGLKLVGDFPANGAAGLPPEPMLMLLLDTATGMPRGLIEMSTLAPLRTGASTAIAARHLARRQPRVLGHLGAGVTAYWNIRLLAGLYDFEEIRLHSKHADSRERLAARLGAELGRELRVTSNWRATVEGADIVIEATRLAHPEPLLKTQWLKRGMCLIPYGSHSALELSVVDVADKIVVDDWVRAQVGPTGALRLHIDSGRLTRDTLHAELGEIVAGSKPGRERDDEIILFWQRSLATSDMALAQAMIEKAQRLGIGQSLPFG